MARPMPRPTWPTLALALALVAVDAAAQPPVEIVVMMRDHAGRDSDLDARPLDDAELELLERVAGIDLQLVRLERNGAQVLVPSGPIDPSALRTVLADLRALPEVVYAEPLPSRVPLAVARSAQPEELIELIAFKPRSRALRERADAGDALNAATEQRLRTIARVDLAYERPASGGIYILRLPRPTALGEAEGIAARLQSDPAIAYAEPVGRAQPQVQPNDPFYALQWHYFEPLGGANLPSAWDVTIGSLGVVVAVLDTGILFGHPDLSGRLLSGFDFISNSTTANDGGGRDNDPTDPGNWVAAGFCGTGTYDDIADALRWAAGLPVPGIPFNNVYPAESST